MQLATHVSGTCLPARYRTLTARSVVVRSSSALSRRELEPAAQPELAAAAAAAGSRRELLLNATLLAGFIAAGPAAAVCSDLDSEEAGDACRQAVLAGDSKSDYSTLSVGQKKALAPNVPVGDLDSEYARATKALASKIDQYITLDVYDKGRQSLIKSLKTDGSAWVSKYARGGSARSQSARNMYIAVDAVQGYLASNGLAPMPANKAKSVRQVMATALAYLDEAR